MEDKLITCSNYKSKIQLYEPEMKIIEESLLTKNDSGSGWDGVRRSLYTRHLFGTGPSYGNIYQFKKWIGVSGCKVTLNILILSRMMTKITKTKYACNQLTRQEYYSGSTEHHTPLLLLVPCKDLSRL